jgi:hypothetical protein
VKKAIEIASLVRETNDMRWLRLGLGVGLMAWVLLGARREALRRGRSGLAAALLLVGGGGISFMGAAVAADPLASNLLLLLAVGLCGGALVLTLWKGFH